MLEHRKWHAVAFIPEKKKLNLHSLVPHNEAFHTQIREYIRNLYYMVFHLNITWKIYAT